VSIIVDESTKVVVQGIGNQGTFHAKRNKAYGTQVVAGVHPKKGGTTWEGVDVPVFAGVTDAVEATGANTSMIMVPAPFAKDAVLEAYEAGIETIIMRAGSLDVLHYRDLGARAAYDPGVLVRTIGAAIRRRPGRRLRGAWELCPPVPRPRLLRAARGLRLRAPILPPGGNAVGTGGAGIALSTAPRTSSRSQANPFPGCASLLFRRLTDLGCR
jgi:hypothetical protein